jgi:hypothetical protein
MYGRVENLLLAILYTSFGICPRDHYMLLQRFTTGVCNALLWFPQKGPSCSAKDSQQRPLLHRLDKTFHKVYHKV